MTLEFFKTITHFCVINIAASTTDSLSFAKSWGTILKSANLPFLELMFNNMVFDPSLGYSFLKIKIFK